MQPMAKRLSTAGLSAGLLLMACDLGPTVVPGPNGTEEQTAREHLAEARPPFVLLGDRAKISLAASLNRGTHWDEATAALALEEGYATLGAEPSGAVTLDGLELDLGDVILGEDVVPGGLHLADIRASIEGPHKCTFVEWSQGDDVCDAEVPITMTLEWKLMVDGETYPLGPQEIGPITVEMNLYRDQQLELDFAATSEGVFWRWDGVIELSDLQILAHATEIVPM